MVMWMRDGDGVRRMEAKHAGRACRLAVFLSEVEKNGKKEDLWDKEERLETCRTERGECPRTIKPNRFSPNPKSM